MRSNYTKFWTWFQSQEQYIFDELEEHPDEIAEQIAVNLERIDSDLVFDIPFDIIDGKREFIVSADGDKNLFPIVQEFVKNAPYFERWKIVGLRPRTNQLDQAIDIDGLYLEYEDIFFVLKNQLFPLDVDVYIKGYNVEDNRYVHGYFLLLDTLVGEYNAVTCFGNTMIHSYEDAPQECKKFIELRTVTDQLLQKKN